MRGNKGEWSELYAFCYLLRSGILIAADKNLNPTQVFFPIIKIPREEIHNNTLNYIPCSSGWNEVKIYDGTDNLLRTVTKDELNTVLNVMYNKIPLGNRAFEIPEVEEFFDNIYVHKLKADSVHKQDIDIQIHDIHTGMTPICGFSIKSYLGARPTLVNPGKNTNIIYKINNCNSNIETAVNAIETRSKIIDRCSLLLENECSFDYLKLTSEQFNENLQFIDTQMPNIIAYTLLIAYKDNIKKLSEAVNKLKNENPMQFANVNVYEYKFKKFLCACALGMTPGKVWEGQEDANGGYIVVKRDGSVVCYHIYNRTDFEQYLYDYTCFDTSSTSRYEYAQIYQDGEDFKIKFNLQIRFTDI